MKGAFARRSIRLALRTQTPDLITLGARLIFDARPLRLRYATCTGALLRIDGVVAAAFDAKHRHCDLHAAPGEHDLTLEVERHGLPIAGLPARDGLRWRWLLARSRLGPTRRLQVAQGGVASPDDAHPVSYAAVGHAHLDVAWLWTYGQTKRKALRTFATALRQIEAGTYVFAQSQPQLYAWVQAGDPALFARLRERVGAGWDASVATMWVEPDLHAPSGESLLRQFAYGMRYARETLGAQPSVVWLPDTFGFPSTLPTLAVHAGATSFVTTKLAWNETTRWPYPQFIWYGPDGSALLAAMLATYDGGVDAKRVRSAVKRQEPLVVGYGDGGGGATDADIARVPPSAWRSVASWFETLDRPALPQYAGELYLETHRGTYTTRRAVKARNAALERALGVAEEVCAWCTAVRVAPSVTGPLAEDLKTAWTIVLRNQCHDVLAGSSVGAVYAEVAAEYERAERIVERVIAGARSILPQSDLRPMPALPVTPLETDADGWTVANDVVTARIKRDGTIVALGALGGPNLVALANGLVAYIDRPSAWDAWNLDARYIRRRVRVQPRDAQLDDGGVVVHFTIGRRSRATMRLELRGDEPYLRVELAVDWQEDQVILRVEHRLSIASDEVRFGQPHGSIERSAVPRTAAQRAQFEVPGQRFALVDDGQRGLAILAPDTYGWSARALRSGGVRLGMSLLRSPRWPDPRADRGEHRIRYALAPTAGATISAVEAAWAEYVDEPRVALFSTETPGVIVVACKPADDGHGVIVRVRECDGAAQRVALRCGGRMRSAQPVDACERLIGGDVAIREEDLRFDLPPYALRAYRVLF